MRPLLAFLMLAPLLLLVACDEAATTSGTVTVAARTATSPTASSGPITLPDGLTRAKVTHVADGDTIDVEIEGVEYQVRYIGMDTPETVDPSRPVGCFGPEASARNKQLVEGKTVGLEKDVSETDKFGRLLRYVWLPAEESPSGQPEMVNAILVREGYAQAKEYPPDTKRQQMFEELQKQAQSARLGLWGDVCGNATPVPTQSPPPASGDTICDYSGTTQAVIKGNISSGGEKIFHVPGQSSYDETKISESRGERWFCTEAEAEAAGWRKSKS